MEAIGESLAEMERSGIGGMRHGEGEGALECPAPEETEEAEQREQAVQANEPESDAPGADAEPADLAADSEGDVAADVAGDWRQRAESAESRVAELGDRLGAVEAAAEDLRRIVGESEKARQIDRELLIAAVVDLDGARVLVEEQVARGATVLEAVSRVKERRPLMFAARARGIRATAVPAGSAGASRSVHEVAAAARETGDRRLLLRYLRMRRGEQ